ncbi:hypothetical protein IQ266_14720 [filamentous cyanobacterium LEGE 11480]|uniref:Uncharacterized protein n=1 Tax=Romeriopsis navalis LEGE 11480 TaxID=2777977 RepID=A0A928VR01_9CYAN|nr:hypothetical protein [Romeriopsis navalis]MBE9030985.1 hypothetical protein [Romeriopsis navalis LEGE 11480]
MAIGDRQLKILQVIHAGHTTGDAIVDAMNSSPQMLSHYIAQMVEDGYIKAARLYDNELRDFVVVRASLTPDGEAVLAQMAQTTPTVAVAQPSPAASANTPPQLVASARSDATGAAADVVTDYSLVGDSLRTLTTLIAELPPDWRDLAAVYLDDLQAEINIAYRRRPIRIRAYFLALLRMVLPVVPQLPHGDNFVQQARLLSRELGIPVKLPGDD